MHPQQAPAIFCSPVHFAVLCSMSLYIASLNSGSNGNCYYIGNDEEAVLIDAGISCRETERRMLRLGLLMRRVKAIFITHEHTDHTRGAEVLSRKHNIPVYITPRTLGNSRLNLLPGLVRAFPEERQIAVGDLLVTAVPKMHDAADPHSFTVSHRGFTVGVFTDLGMACSNVSESVASCHALFLEANYDEAMLANGSYPAYLKKRISSMEGHLSNNQALDLVTNHRNPNLQLLLLSHLSAENNHPLLVHELFSRHTNGHSVAVMSRYEESELFTITPHEG